jgi:hypothetical protein
MQNDYTTPKLRWSKMGRLCSKFGLYRKTLCSKFGGLDGLEPPSLRLRGEFHYTNIGPLAEKTLYIRLNVTTVLQNGDMGLSLH